MEPKLLSPLTIRDLTLRNRVVLSPMLTYSATNGHTNDWHLMHLGKFAAGGVGLVMMESTKIDPAGCTTPRDCGIWKDDFIPALSRIAALVKNHGAAAGIQLGHSGRKARNVLPWEGRTPDATLEGVDHGERWELVGPSALQGSPDAEVPHVLTIDEIHDLVRKWGEAARRADDAGFDVVEIHGAHGYLIHQFLSPESNRRDDEYGGSPEGRMRFALEVVQEVRRNWPAGKPLFFRASAIDEAGCRIEDTVDLCKALYAEGVDLIDCSTGGMWVPAERRPPRNAGYGYQVPHAEHVRKRAGVATMAVGAIVHGDQAERILQQDQADLVAIGRELLHNPNWVFDAAAKLGSDTPYAYAPDAYGYWLALRQQRQDEYTPIISGDGIEPSTQRWGIESVARS